VTSRHSRRSQPRVPGTVAEVMGSPEGPEIAAFFDLDGTIVAGFTVTVYTKTKIRRGDFGVSEIYRILATAYAFQMGRSTFQDFAEAGLSTLAGKSLAELEEESEEVFKRKIADLIYPETRALVRAHVERGHRVVLCSSATSIQVEPVARWLGIDEVVCNRFILDDQDRVTGRLVTPVIWGEGKASAAQRYAATHGIDLAHCYFYADGDEDVALMHLVGNPRPTNPGPELTRVAEKRGWPITRHRSRSAGGASALVRTVASLGALAPIATAGLGIGILKGDKRSGLNVLTSLWPRLMLETNGVRLRIVGEDNARVTRPAVFLFNHRNNFDAMVAAAVVKDDFTFVAKAELKTHLLVGTFGRAMDGVFIERSDSAGSVASLQEAQDLLVRKNLSVIVAPEGTRQDRAELGSFKKGPFRMAMATGLPIVPIVIRNASDMAGRGGSAINAAEVDVAVLPPISVDDWTVDDVDERIAQVRDLFLDVLHDWPTEGDPRV
jgi:putative phosphoserine phosphatase/1-acylglycerol-3-phosphate O-acyltransferase